MAQALNQRTDAILRRLVRKEAGPAIRKLLKRTRDEDLAAAMDLLTAAEKRRLYKLIENQDQRAQILANVNDEGKRDLTREMTQEEVVRLLERMDPDDATDVVEALPEELRVQVIAELDKGKEDDVSQLLSYPSDSAGGLMSPMVFKIEETATCGEAIETLQEHAESLESVYYVYVTDARNKLVGVVSLRRLLMHPSRTPIVSVMDTEVLSVVPFTDQEEVARFVARYDLLAMPVVDEEGKLLGIVTVDDVVDVLHEEAVEDMMLMAGVEADFDLNERSVFGLARMRGTWLVATACGGVVADRVAHLFGQPLPMEILAGLIPVVMGMGGNVGIQSTTIAVRGLATGQIQLGGAVQYIGRELRVGVLLGLTYGSALALYAMIAFWPDPSMAITVFSSLLFTMTLGSALGSGLPILLQRLGADPAVATGPFVTTSIDVMGIAVYLSIARLVMGL